MPKAEDGMTPNGGPDLGPLHPEDAPREWRERSFAVSSVLQSYREAADAGEEWDRWLPAEAGGLVVLRLAGELESAANEIVSGVAEWAERYGVYPSERREWARALGSIADAITKATAGDEVVNSPDDLAASLDWLREIAGEIHPDRQAVNAEAKG